MVNAKSSGVSNMSAIPILSIVGKSNSGKTTLIEKILKTLVTRGYRIATIKHHAHAAELDRPGKDTFRHREAGAEAVVLTSSDRLFLTRSLDTQPSLEKIRDTYLNGNFDLVLTEGFKKESAPKIEVNRKARSTTLICASPKDSLVAVVSDQKFDIAVPHFHIDDHEAVADFIEARFIQS